MTSLETLTTVLMMVLVRWFPSVRIRERLSSVWESWLVVGVGFSLLYFSSVSFTLIVFSGKSSNSLKVQFGHVCSSWHILPSLCVRGV